MQSVKIPPYLTHILKVYFYFCTDFYYCDIFLVVYNFSFIFLVM